jgi:hypothetical protein
MKSLPCTIPRSLLTGLLLAGCAFGSLDDPPDAEPPAPIEDARVDALDAQPKPLDAQPPIPCVIAPEVVQGRPLDDLLIAGPRDPRLRRWTWRLVQAPEGAQPILAESIDALGVAQADNVTTPELSFVGDLAGRYQLELDVQDASGVACPPMALTIDLQPPPGLYLELRWAPEADLDLVLTHPEGPCPASDTEPRPAGVGADAPDWRPPGPENNPQLLRTDDRGPGPELLHLSTAGVAGDYQVIVRGFSLSAPTALTISAWIDGAHHSTRTATLTETGSVWTPYVWEVPCAGCAPALREGAATPTGRWGLCL